MKILGILGSPRKDGNTDVLLEAALNGARREGAFCEKIVLNDLNFKPCQECGGCYDDGACVTEDDMRLVYTKMDAADAVIIASPVFFGSVSAQLKAMIDRYNCRWIRKFRLKQISPAGIKKEGAFLCVAASDKKQFFENSRQIIKILFISLDIAYSGELFCTGMDAKDSAVKDKECMNKANVLGATLARNIAGEA